MIYEVPRILSGGDGCLVVEYADEIDIGANGRLNSLRRLIEAEPFPGMIECVPTYRSLAIYFDPARTSAAKTEAAVAPLLGRVSDSETTTRTIVVMPVCYGGEFGPDLAGVAAHTGLSEEEVVRRHTSRDCYCFMLGFTPGFSYLGGMDESLATPRLAEPRVKIPAGSVGIAGKQTGAYSIDSPGGWQLIGRTPLRLFDPTNELAPTLIEAGEWIRFESIAEREFKDIADLVSAGRYEPKRMTEGGRA